MLRINNIKSRLHFEQARISFDFYNYFDKKYPKILVVGHGRSGTTWLSNLINFSNNYSFYFEPIHKRVLMEKSDGFVNHYVSSRDDNLELYNFVQSVFSHSFYHKRVFSNKFKLFYKGLLVKDINSNLIIKWIKHNFPEIKIIFLLRHPFAVSVSIQKLHNWSWDNDVNTFYEQDELFNKYLYHFSDLLTEAKTEFEKRVLIWSILHYVPFSELDSSDCLVVFYENLCIDPINEMNIIFEYLNMKNSDKDLKVLEQKVSIPSKVANRQSAIYKGSNLIDTWKNKLSSKQIDSGLNILQRFELNKIYNDKLMPEVNGLEHFLNKI